MPGPSRTLVVCRPRLSTPGPPCLPAACPSSGSVRHRVKRLVATWADTHGVPIGTDGHSPVATACSPARTWQLWCPPRVPQNPCTQAPNYSNSKSLTAKRTAPRASANTQRGPAPRHDASPEGPRDSTPTQSQPLSHRNTPAPARAPSALSAHNAELSLAHFVPVVCKLRLTARRATTSRHGNRRSRSRSTRRWTAQADPPWRATTLPFPPAPPLATPWLQSASSYQTQG